jgi:ornithine decarboxylase
MIEPFYAVKCNPDPVIVRTLASMGCNFDCATMGEIDLVLNGLGDDLSFGPRGKASTSIVYANPAKMENMIRFALENDVHMTVFDGEDELHKIASIPGSEKFELLLRLTTDDRASICRFSKKFGCPVEEAPKLLEVAKSLGLHVAGVSFHVGSGCGDADAYVTALKHAKCVYDTAESLGMRPMNIIDIGGGFPGDSGGYGGPGMPTFQDLAAAIRRGIDSFADNLDRPISAIRFIAEPGRYFVSASTAIATKIYSRKGGNSDYQALYVDDGVYGSFNNVVYDHANPTPQRLSSLVGLTSNEKVIPSAVFGPTCDGLDQMCSLDNTTLPRCNVGEWLFWDNMGAYTHTASFVFNGYTHIPPKTYCYL